MKVILALVMACTLGVGTQRAMAHACCLPDGNCINLMDYECLALGGIYYPTLFCGDPGVVCAAPSCRMTGGGVDTFGNWDPRSFCVGHQGRGNQVDRYTFGGQAGAPTASQPQPFGEWTHHQQSGPSGDFVFHAGTASAPAATEIDLVLCTDPGYCRQARPAPNKQIDFEGVGTFRNIRNPTPAMSGVVAGVTLHWFSVHVEDLGEPGRNGRQNPAPGHCPNAGSAGELADCGCPDFYRIRIHTTQDPASAVMYEVYGYIDGGNLQIHPGIH